MFQHIDFFPHLLLYPIFIHQDFRLKFKWMQMETAEHGTSNTEVDETESVWTNAYRALSNPFDFSQFGFIYFFSNSKLIFLDSFLV